MRFGENIYTRELFVNLFNWIQYCWKKKTLHTQTYIKHFCRTDKRTSVYGYGAYIDTYSNHTPTHKSLSNIYLA